ncbi:MAG: bifunctional diaminohydroxyphosphoribosylaminopyrimidine deaminase/5-amino-6-(5-phosphoribosylamino)uracil reductase, partial [Saprospiraceae bacterium]
RVVISNVDPNPLVAGQSVARMRAAGIEVITGVLEQEGTDLNRVFFNQMTQKRPYVVLKWAQSADGFIGRVGERTAISGPVAQRLVHRWRSELDAILVGARTARMDNPRLDARLVHGRPPLRIALDQKGDIPQTHHLFDDSQPTWILGPERQGKWAQTQFMPVPASWGVFLNTLYDHRIASLLVEGGASVLQQFMEAGLWDEMRVLETPRLVLGHGIAAPRMGAGAIKVSTVNAGEDQVSVYAPLTRGLRRL